MVEAGQGGAQPNLTNAIVRQWPFPLPPLAEQRRIVAAVEALLARVQAARARLAKVPALLRRFRQSVLAAACSGELTANWREQHPDTGNPAALLDSLCASPYDSVDLGYGIPKSWVSTTCIALCRKDRALTYGVIKLGAPVEDGVPTLRSSDVRPLRIEEGSVKRIRPEIAGEYRRTFLEGGEIVVTVRGTLGGVAVVPPSMRGYNVSREVAVIPIHSKLDARFFCLAIASLPSQNWLTGVEKGVAYTGINIEDLKCLPLEDLRLNGERYTSERKLARLIGCKKFLVGKAIGLGSVELQDWAKRQRGVSRLNVTPEVSEIVLDNAAQRRERDPSDYLPDDDVELEFRRVLEMAGPEELAKLHAMTPAQKRQLVEIIPDFEAAEQDSRRRRTRHKRQMVRH